jgi:hypothetical protein
MVNLTSAGNGATLHSYTTMTMTIRPWKIWPTIGEKLELYTNPAWRPTREDYAERVSLASARKRQRPQRPSRRPVISTAPRCRGGGSAMKILESSRRSWHNERHVMARKFKPLWCLNNNNNITFCNVPINFKTSITLLLRFLYSRLYNTFFCGITIWNRS